MILNLVGESLGDFMRRGLPIVGGIAGAAIASRRSKTLRRTSAGAALGWLAGWGTSRTVFWFLDLFEPTLPLTQTYEEELPATTPATAPRTVEGTVTPNVVMSGGDFAKNVTPRVNTRGASHFSGAYGR